MRSLPWLAAGLPLVSLLFALPHCSSAQLVQPTPLADAGPGATNPDAESPVDPGEPPPVPTDPTDPDAGPIPDGPIPTTSDVTVQVMPSDKGQAIIDSIKGAKTSVHATLYLLTGSSFEQAFIDAKKAGRDVKVVQRGVVEQRGRGLRIRAQPPRELGACAALVGPPPLRALAHHGANGPRRWRRLRGRRWRGRYSHECC